MGKAKLLLVVHNHQPTGNFDDVIGEATDRCYERFVAALESSPHVKAGLHYTGPLLEWLERNRPEVIARVRALAECGRVEVVGGAWYEPMLCVLPDRDALGQIRTMRYECARLFGRVPQGMWLAERVWDPDLPRILAAAGVRYVLLDDSHFRCAGVRDEWITGYYLTEKAGSAVAVFPIAKQLRYAIPFHEAARTVDEIAARQGEYLVYGDDGEKFGVWPETDVWVWEKGWMRDFFELLGERSGEVETILPSQALGAPEALRGRIYLPTASYHEMGEWSLPVEAGRALADLRGRLEREGAWDAGAPFVRGGIWQNFLAKYPEANRMHKRMLRVSRKVDAAIRSDPLYPRSMSAANARARLELYRGQCNCPYWHGLFGGLYLPHLRNAVHAHLIRAERMVDPCPAPRLTVEDWDLDGAPEILIETTALAAAIKPHLSGSLERLDLRDKAFDLLDTLARRPEIYHDAIARGGAAGAEGGHGAAEDANGAEGGHGAAEGASGAESGSGAGAPAGGAEPASIHNRVRKVDPHLRELLRYDDLPRTAFLDRLLPPDAAYEQWDGGTLEPWVDARAFHYAIVRADPGAPTVAGLRASVESPYGRVAVEKTFSLDPTAAAIEARWTLATERGREAVPCRFATEMTINLLAGSDPLRGYAFDDPAFDAADSDRALASRGELAGIRRFRLINGWDRFEIAIDCDGPAYLWRRPVVTVSQSEEGFEAVFQGSNLWLVWPCEIGPGRAPTYRVRISAAAL